MPTDVEVLSPMLADTESQEVETKEGPKTGDREPEKEPAPKEG